jgi:hypothetical protein
VRVLAARVDEHEISAGDRAVVFDVVEDGRVVAGTDDRRVARTRAARAAEGVVDQGLDLVLEHAGAPELHRGEMRLAGDRARLAQRGQLLGTLVQPQLVQLDAEIDHRAGRALPSLLALAQPGDR